MATSPRSRQTFRFGPFQADPASGELSREGYRLKLPDQSFRILILLLEHAGEVVTRDELRNELWRDDTFVDFEAGLNNAVRRLRDALNEAADSPRYIETLPRRGYRFIAPVASDSVPTTSTSPAASTPARRYNKRWLIALAVVVGVALPALLGIRKSSSPTVPPTSHPAQTTADPEAQGLYDKGRYYFFRENRDDVLRARAFFEEAIDRDPTYAQAYAALGDTYDWMALEGFQPSTEVTRQATEAKTKANSLNPSSAEVHSSLGSLAFVKWDWAAAEPEFQKAIRLDPRYFEAHRLYSIYLRTMRRFPEAIREAKLCDELNPLLSPAKSHLALTYLYAGQSESAAEQYRLILKDEPQSPSAHAGLAAALFRLGKEKEGVQEWQKALATAGDDATARRLGETYQSRGLVAARATVLQSELRSLDELARDSYVSPVEFAYRYALLNDKEKAFRWLERAYAEHSPQLLNINVDPDYDNLRSDPRFGDLLGRLHLPQ